MSLERATLNEQYGDLSLGADSGGGSARDISHTAATIATIPKEISAILFVDICSLIKVVAPELCPIALQDRRMRPQTREDREQMPEALF